MASRAELKKPISVLLVEFQESSAVLSEPRRPFAHELTNPSLCAWLRSALGTDPSVARNA